MSLSLSVSVTVPVAVMVAVMSLLPALPAFNVNVTCIHCLWHCLFCCLTWISKAIRNLPYFLWKRLVIGQFKNSRYLLYQSEIKRNSQTIISRVSPAPATGNYLTFDWTGPLMKTTSTRYCWDKVYRIKCIVKKLKSIDRSRSSNHCLLLC